MRRLKAALAVAGASAYLAASPAPLRVLRATPEDTAGRAASIEITFDRPVAGSLDRSVDPRTIVSVVPAVPGRVEWRDPVTIVLTSAGLLDARAQRRRRALVRRRPLVAGTHIIRASASANRSDEVRVTIER